MFVLYVCLGSQHFNYSQRESQEKRCSEKNKREIHRSDETDCPVCFRCAGMV